MPFFIFYSSFLFFFAVFLFCCYPNSFHLPLNSWLQYFPWPAEGCVCPNYDQGQTQNIFFMPAQSATCRKKASLSPQGKAASSILGKHDLCLWLTEKAVKCIITLSFTYFTWLFERFMDWFPDRNSQSYHFSRSFIQWSKQKTGHLIGKCFFSSSLNSWSRLMFREVLVWPII